MLKDEKGKPLRQFSYKIIQPESDELGEVLDANPAMLRQRYTLGRKRAEEAFANPDDPNWPRDVAV